MNSEERKAFWNTLTSLKGEDVATDEEKLMKSIKYPQYLYRYREVNTKNLEALRTNRMYFSSANYYDDPFDTFLQIDLDKIKEEINAVLKDDTKIYDFVNFLQGENSLALKKILEMNNISILDRDAIKELFNEHAVNNFIYNMGEFRNIIKKDMWSVCFSENAFNETLWLKYAKHHTGFALMYDLNDREKFLCGKQNKCQNCMISHYRTPLYPIYYSDEKYDATNFTKFIISKMLEEKFSLYGILDKFFPSNYNPTWEREKIALIKKECHMFDEEWRMVISCEMNSPIMREWIPSGVILGLKMDKNEENLVVNLAKQAGIEHIYESYIDNKGRLNARRIGFGEDKTNGQTENAHAE